MPDSLNDINKHHQAKNWRLGLYLFFVVFGTAPYLYVLATHPALAWILLPLGWAVILILAFAGKRIGWSVEVKRGLAYVMSGPILLGGAISFSFCLWHSGMPTWVYIIALLPYLLRMYWRPLAKLYARLANPQK